MHEMKAYGGAGGTKNVYNTIKVNCPNISEKDIL
jgi:hypothetical protein